MIATFIGVASSIQWKLELRQPRKLTNISGQLSWTLRQRLICANAYRMTFANDVNAPAASPRNLKARFPCNFETFSPAFTFTDRSDSEGRLCLSEHGLRAIRSSDLIACPASTSPSVKRGRQPITT